MNYTGKSIFLTAFFFLSINITFAQTIEEATSLFSSKQYDSASVMAKEIIAKNKNTYDAYIIAGRSLVAIGNYDEAIQYLENIETLPDVPPYDRAWAMNDLGLCYYSKGDYPKAKKNILDCIELNATKNATSTAKNRLLRLGFDTLYNSWSIRESANFIFHFQDSSMAVTSGATLLIKMKEDAYDSINSFFRSKLPKKIDYFIWRDSNYAREVLGRDLAFSDPGLCITHTDRNHTIGHEMTHSISFHATKIAKRTPLIAEGVCVYFDLSRKNNLAILKAKNKDPISIAEIWKSRSKQHEELTYPLGGELVKRLIESFGREKFIKLLANQTYENAKYIYGEELDKTLKALEEEIYHR